MPFSFLLFFLLLFFFFSFLSFFKATAWMQHHHSCASARASSRVSRGWRVCTWTRACVWAVVHGGGTMDKGESRRERERVNEAPYVTWSRTSEQIDEAKAIKWEEGFASLERWLPWICEWIKKRSAWMTAWMKEQWMNTIELSPPHLIHPLNLLMMKLLTKKAN